MGNEIDVKSDLSICLDSYINNMKSLAIKYKKNVVSAPFNIILAASDYYYRENFHSDIIATILKNDRFFSPFVNWINSLGSLNIDVSKYDNREITRETTRIDILINDKSSKKCIIIENKINNACDMDRQIPRYVEIERSSGYDVEAVLYLSMNGEKRPDTRSWSNKDKEIVIKNILYCAAVNDKDNCMLNGYLKKCLTFNSSMEEYSFLEQYMELLTYLGGIGMNNEVMNQFYQKNLDKKIYDSSIKYREMLNSLIEFRRDKLLSNYLERHDPFDNISRYSNYDTLFYRISSFTNQNIKLDIIISELSSTMRFWIQQPTTNDDKIKELLEEMRIINDFNKKEQNCFEKVFTFPEEENELYNYIDSFLNKLKEVVDVRK